jgi:hypothetical protein
VKLLWGLVLLCGCGYRWQPEYPLGEKPTVWVPLIGGDEDGGLTSEIIRKLHASGLVAVDRQEGHYRLEVVISRGDVKTIGFRRDPEIVAGKLTKNLIASEGRKIVAVEVTLYEGKSTRVAYGPYKIAADADFDYVIGDSLRDLAFGSPGPSKVVVLPFSLGQLEPSEAAQEAAASPLYESIAEKIVDAIAAEW